MKPLVAWPQWQDEQNSSLPLHRPALDMCPKKQLLKMWLILIPWYKITYLDLCIWIKMLLYKVWELSSWTHTRKRAAYWKLGKHPLLPPWEPRHFMNTRESNILLRTACSNWPGARRTKQTCWGKGILLRLCDLLTDAAVFLLQNFLLPSL